MRIVGKNYFTSFVSSAHNADVNDSACARAIRVAGVQSVSDKRISGPTLPTTTQPGETAAALAPTGAAAVSSSSAQIAESPWAKPPHVMHHKHKSLIASKPLQADRKQLLKEIASNIEQLCRALSRVAPHLIEIHKADDCKATLSFDTTWFQQVSGATRSKTQKPGETIVATDSTKSTSGLEDFFPKRSANGSARANHATR